MEDHKTCLGELRLLNRRAWAARWRCRRDSNRSAARVLDHIHDGPVNGCDVEKGYAHRTLAWQAKWRGAFEDAMTFCLKAEEGLSEAQHPVARADLYSILGVVHYSRNRLDLANCAVGRGLAILPKGEAARHAEIDLLTTLASVQRYAGQSARANVTLGRALDLAERDELARVEHNVARCVLADNDAEQALPHAEAAVALAREHTNNVVLPYALEVLGDCYQNIGELDAAGAAFCEGLQLAMADEDLRAECQILHKFGQLELKRGEPEKALDLFQHGCLIAGRMNYGLWAKSLTLDKAEALEALGRIDEALEAHKTAWGLVAETRT